MRKRKSFIVLILFSVLIMLLCAATTNAQDETRTQRAPEPTPTPAPTPPPPKPAPAPTPAPAPAAQHPAAVMAPLTSAKAAPVLPWCVLVGRMAIGGGSGTTTFHWDGLGDLADHEEKNVPMSLGQFALYPEVFFMPTKGRHFIISASLPFGGGSGKMGKSEKLKDSDFPQNAGDSWDVHIGDRYLYPGDRIFDGEAISYRFVFLNLGLGYQWFFGAEQKTNLFLMSHIGPGRTQWAINYHSQTRVSDPIGGWDFDISVGSWHRWSNGFVLGGSLDLWWMGYSGKAGDSDLIDTTMNGGAFVPRLNLIAGYAFE